MATPKTKTHPKPKQPKLLEQVRHTIRVKHYRDIRAVQELLGHKDVETTMVYTHLPCENNFPKLSKIATKETWRQRSRPF